MARTTALALRPSEFDSMWAQDEPDLVLDAEDGTIRPVRRASGGGSPVASSVGRAAAAVPVAAGVVISEIARWD